jgi:Bacterial SH3 domain
LRPLFDGEVLKVRSRLRLNIRLRGAQRVKEGKDEKEERKRRAMSLIRIAVSAAVFTLLSAVCGTAKPIATTAETNMRKSPGTDGPVLTIIPKGTTVEVGKCNKGWCETSVDGRDGFVIARNLGLAPVRRARATPQVYDGEVVEEVGPPVYDYRYHGPYYGYGSYHGYYGGWGGWRW